jgi:hypothetical protein
VPERKEDLALGLGDEDLVLEALTAPARRVHARQHPKDTTGDWLNKDGYEKFIGEEAVDITPEK